jgi:hypothetical protein
VLARDLKDRANRYAIARGSALEDSSCPNCFYALKTLSISPVEEYDYVQTATSTSCVHVLVHPDVYFYLCTIRYL